MALFFKNVPGIDEPTLHIAFEAFRGMLLSIYDQKNFGSRKRVRSVVIFLLVGKNISIFVAPIISSLLNKPLYGT